MQKSLSPIDLNAQANGFILLEVLLAMSLVASSWIGLSNTYHAMTLRLSQLQEKRIALRKEMDWHELAILTAIQFDNLNPTSRKLVNESIGVSRRPHSVSSLGRTTHQK